MNSIDPLDIVFSPAVKAAQQKRGTRQWCARLEAEGGFPNEIDQQLAEFIATRDSFYFGTASRDGQPYIQHRGGPKGFLKVLGQSTLAFGDVAGNSQFITVGNLDENDRAFLFLIDYPSRRRVKLWGTAEVVEHDDQLLSRVATDDQTQRVIVFRVVAWNANCPKGIRQRWAIDEIDGRMQELSDQVQRLNRENRTLRTQLLQLQTAAVK